MFGLGAPEGVVLFVLLAAVLLYFLPTIAALRRKHHQRGAILALNLFLGWTVLGWIGAIVWASTAVRPEGASSPAASVPQPGTRYCTHCGSLSASDVRFCPRCGTATGTAKAG